MRRNLVPALLAGMLLATGVTAVMVARSEQRSADRERQSEARRAAAQMESRFELSLGALATVQGLFDASEEVTGSEFAAFAKRLLPNSPLSAAMLTTRVPGSLRESFEASPGSSPIRELVDGRIRPAREREEYYPISYRYSSIPGFGRRLPVGLDLASDPVRGEALRAARDRGAAQASAPVVLHESGRRGLLIFTPIYARGAQTATLEQRRSAITALAASAYDARSLGDSVRAARTPGTEVQILDGNRRLYGPRGELDDAIDEHVSAAGRRWTLRMQIPAGASMALAWTVLGGGLALTALVALLLAGLQRRERYANDLSDRRLAEREEADGARRAAEERFQRAFEDSGVGMTLVGAAEPGDDRLLEVNDALCKLLGYPRDRLLQMRMSQLVHPDDTPAAIMGLSRTAPGRDGALHAEHRMVDALGQPIWVLLSTSVVRDAEGKPAHHIIQVQDVSERKRFEGQLQHLADHDPLTGIFNRRRFEDELSRELAASERYGRGGAVLALDLDHFKYINDSLGHSAGDELIAKVSGLLQDRLRDTDVLARLGGDEFAVILPEADEERARSVADTLLRTIREGAAVSGKHGQARVTASAGIALFDGAEGLTGEELLSEADIAMYDAKEGGRDGYAIYATSGREARMAARITWVERIRRALAEDRFVLHAQRIESLHEDDRVREELLLRMVGDDGDLIPPASFLLVAERFDLIQEIDRWVVRRAIELLARKQADGIKAVLEVNLSAKSVTDPELPDFIRGELARHEVDPSGLVFEMTETAAIVNLEFAKRFAAFVGELGCEFALDDFGAGFASFYYLKHFAFDYLKIDGEFIEDLPVNETNQLLVRALVGIARGLGKRTIAEFVTNQETLDLLRELGVDYAQGFHVARPGPVDESPAPARR